MDLSSIFARAADKNDNDDDNGIGWKKSEKSVLSKEPLRIIITQEASRVRRQQRQPFDCDDGEIWC